MLAEVFAGGNERAGSVARVPLEPDHVLTSLRTLVIACPTVQAVLDVGTKAEASERVYDRYASDELTAGHDSPLVNPHPRVILDDDLGRVIDVYGQDMEVVKGQLAVIVEYEEVTAEWLEDFYSIADVAADERDQLTHAMNMANRITDELKNHSRTEPGALIVTSIQNDVAIRYDEKEQNGRPIWALIFMVSYEGQF